MLLDRIPVTAGDGTASAGVAAPARGLSGKPGPGRRRLRLGLTLFGVASLAYVRGAAVMFFQLPGSAFLHKAFVGAQAWRDWEEASSEAAREQAPFAITVSTDRPGQTFDGFTLCTYGPGTRAALVNMSGEVVHEWGLRFSEVWPAPTHVPPPPNDRMVTFFSTHLYPNGELLAVMHGPPDPANGYGLVKLDRDSHVVWKYAGNVHHDADVGEDGTVYATRQELIRQPPAGLEFIPTPCVVDHLVVLSPAGQELKSIPILEALRDSPYRALLCAIEQGDSHRAAADGQRPPGDDDARRRDVLHTNCVKVLTRALAPKFPQFKAGQVLLSMRHLDAIAVMDVASGSVVWAARGPWRAQHDPTFLDNGRLLIFDNLGSPRTSRVLEYDPQTQAFPWSYPAEDGPPFRSYERGMSQRLPNGNTLVVDSIGHTILEVTRDRELVWSCSCPEAIHSARRYGPQQLHFLKGDVHVRP